MNEAIMKWSSEKLYEGRLQADASVKNHLLKDLPGVEETEETILPLLLIDTTGCDVSEKEVEDEVSKGNEGEADIVASHVTALISAGLQPTDIAVIAPYNLQVSVVNWPFVFKYFAKVSHPLSFATTGSSLPREGRKIGDPGNEVDVAVSN